MIDTAVYVAFLVRRHGALEPGSRRRTDPCPIGNGPSGSGSGPRLCVIDTAVHVALLGDDGALEPGLRGGKSSRPGWKAPPTNSPFSSKSSRPAPFQLSSSTG